MKFILIALLASSAVLAQKAAAQHPSPEAVYYASRDAYMAQLDAISAAGKIDDETWWIGLSVDPVAAPCAEAPGTCARGFVCRIARVRFRP